MEQQVFPFLLANGIEPIVISGAPQEPLELYEKRMNFKSVYGIKYDLKDGVYTDICSTNTAIADGKAVTIQEILRENPDAKIIFGFGDSEADIPILESAELGFINNSNKFINKPNMHYLDFSSLEAGEQIIELMTQELARLNKEKYEVLTCVDKTGEPTGEFVNRNYFYSGNCPNKRICGVQFWIFDKQGNLLLAERESKKEQGGGKISPPSGHVQYERASGEKERPIQGCFNEIEEEIGLHWNYENFPFTDDYYPIGIIDRPGKSAENCEMLVKHYALLLNDEAKGKIKNNEAKRIFFESWDSAREKFGVDDNIQGVYQFFGTNKMEILGELDRFVQKISLLDKIGEDATWDIIALDDCDAVEQYRTEVREDKKGYATWEIISTREDLMHETEGENTIWETIRVAENISREDIEDIIAEYGKVIKTSKQDIIDMSMPKRKEHSSDEFSNIVVSKSELSDIIKMTRMFKKIENQNDKGAEEK